MDESHYTIQEEQEASFCYECFAMCYDWYCDWTPIVDMFHWKEEGFKYPGSNGGGRYAGVY